MQSKAPDFVSLLFLLEQRFRRKVKTLQVTHAYDRVWRKRRKEQKQNTEKKAEQKKRSYLIRGFCFISSLCLHGPPNSLTNLLMDTQAETGKESIQFRVSRVSVSCICSYIYIHVCVYIYPQLLKRRTKRVWNHTVQRYIMKGQKATDRSWNLGNYSLIQGRKIFIL